MSKFYPKKAFELIQSMAGSEKRQITAHSQSDSKYFQLYQQLLHQNQFDRKLLPKPLISAGKHLYEHIFRVMRYLQNNQDSLFSRVKEKLIDARFLKEKRLFQQCGDRLQEAKADALKTGDLLTLLEINKEARFLAHYSKSFRNAQESEESYMEESERLLKLLSEEILYYNIYDQLLPLAQKVKIAGRPSPEKLQSIVPLDLLEESRKPKSIQGERRFLLCNALYHFLLNDFDTYHLYYSRVIEWWNAHSYLISESPYPYFNDLKSYFTSCITAKRFKIAEQILAQYDKTRGSIRDDRQKELLKERSLEAKLYYYLVTSQNQKALSLVKGVESVTKKLKLHQFPLHFNVASLLFVEQNYSECMDWCSKLMRVKTDERLEIQVGTRLLHLISCYEVEYAPQGARADVFASAQRKTKRFFNKIKLPTKSFEWTIYHHLDQLEKAFPDEKKAILQKILANIDQLKGTSRIEKNEIYSWANRKLSI